MVTMTPCTDTVFYLIRELAFSMQKLKWMSRISTLTSSSKQNSSQIGKQPKKDLKEKLQLIFFPAYCLISVLACPKFLHN